MSLNYTVKQGDTLNSIAQRYGFKNYRDAGISNVPSGNFDLIRAGENITLGNYNPNQVSGINTGSSVVSSQDNASSFNNNSNQLDSLTNRQPIETENKEEVRPASIDVNKDGKLTTGDPVLDKLNASEQQRKLQAEAEAERQKQEYEKLFKTQMSLIDANASATTRRIYDTYDKRLEEQRRLNDLNVARVKAYGLGGGGRFTPISFGDAITEREREASDRIMGLERERDNLIALAEIARREGESAMLEGRMEQIFNIEDQLRKNLQNIEKQAQDQYKLLRELRQDEEAKHQKAVEEMQQKLAVFAMKSGDELENMSPEEKDQLISQIMGSTGMDYFTVYSTLHNAQKENLLDKLSIEKKRADITATHALTNQRNRANQNTGGGADDFSSSDKKKLEQAGLLNADRQTKLDYLHGDDIEREDARNSVKGVTPQTLVSQGKLTQAQLDSARKEGYSDEEIVNYFN